MSSSLYNIEKLSESNYDSWCMQIKSVLVHQDLWEVVSGDLPRPVATATNQKDVISWKTKDEKATATLIWSISASQLAFIKNTSSAQNAWMTLRDLHRPRGPVRKVTLFKQILSMRMSDDDDIQQYICKFSSLVDKLTETGISLQEEMFVIMLLASLPKSYENFVVALESRDNLPKLTAIKLKLVEEGQRRKSSENVSADTSVEIFMARSNNGQKQHTTKRFNNNEGNNKKLQIGKCYNCGRKGHYAAKCRERDSRRDQKPTSFSVFTKFGSSSRRENMWCLDSGASAHLCCCREMFQSFSEYEEMISLAGDNTIKARGIGEVRIKTKDVDILLKQVLFVPGLQCNFISVGKAVKNNMIVKFSSNAATIANSKGLIIFEAKKIGDLFLFETRQNLFLLNRLNNEAEIWHNRYGHLNYMSLKQLAAKEMVHGLHVKYDDISRVNCEVCLKAKCCAMPFSSSSTRAKQLLEIVHTDVCGPINIKSIGGSRYFLTLIDDFSRFVTVYFLKEKTEVFNKFIEFQFLVERQTGKQIKVLRSDNGTEFVNNKFDEYLKKCGIKRQLTVPYTPQQNGVAERFNRTLVEMARCMIIGAGGNESLWAEAVYTAAYLRNRAPTKALDEKTPYEMWFNRKPNISHLKIFGSLAIALDKTQHSKFKPKGKEYVMVGYSDTSKAYRLLEKATGKIIVSRDVFFVEKQGPVDDVNFEIESRCIHQDQSSNKEEVKAQTGNINIKPTEYIEEADSDNEDEEDVTSAKRGPGRPKLLRSGAPGRPRKQYNMLNCIQSDVIKVPETADEALSGEYSAQWKEAMLSEYNALLKNKTWELSELPEGQKAVGSKWVFAVKRNQHGDIDRFKARLVAKGCCQIYDLNYTETFSPVVRYETIRLILALAAKYELFLHQLDVSTAYLNSELDDEVYMVQPKKFVDKEYPNHVLKLKKAIYGLKQSGRQWNLKLDKILKNIGFRQCESEPCLYTRNKNGRINIICVYVDDLLIASSDNAELQQIKDSIGSQVEVVDKGAANYFLSIEIERCKTTGEISICQKAYIKKLLQQYQLENSRTVATPLEPKHQIKCDDFNCLKVEPATYQSLIGSLMYIAILTRPDILHSVCKLAQKNVNPHHEHMVAAKRILKYLNKTADIKLRYQKSDEPLQCYVDADWGGDAEDRKSYTGYVFLLAGAAFSWECRKQTTVALNSTEAEYMALSSAAKEAIYVRKLLCEMGLQVERPVIMNGDNLSAMHLVRNSTYHNRSKHIDIRFHHIRDAYKRNEIELKNCSSTEMIADIFTKNLPKFSHNKLMLKLGLMI